MFNWQVSDRSPKHAVLSSTYLCGQVSRALEKVALEKGLQLHATWLNKCIQLYETYLVRHGIMLVGPSGGGKSSIEECLAGALTELGTKHVIWRMNPKVG